MTSVRLGLSREITNQLKLNTQLDEILTLIYNLISEIKIFTGTMLCGIQTVQTRYPIEEV